MSAAMRAVAWVGAAKGVAAETAAAAGTTTRTARSRLSTPIATASHRRARRCAEPTPSTDAPHAGRGARGRGNDGATRAFRQASGRRAGCGASSWCGAELLSGWGAVAGPYMSPYVTATDASRPRLIDGECRRPSLRPPACRFRAPRTPRLNRTGRRHAGSESDKSLVDAAVEC